MQKLDDLVLALLANPLNVVFVAVLVLTIVLCIAYFQQFLFILKNLSRNLIRSILVSIAVMLLVFVITMVWTVTGALDKVTEEKSKDFKAIVTERWQIPSQMPFSYERDLSEGAVRRPGDVTPQDSMSWQFYGGTIDKEHLTRENIVFFFCMDPKKLLRMENDKPVTMMDDIDQFSTADLGLLARACEEMEKDPRKVVIGVERLEAMKKRVGETIRVSSVNYRDIDLELEIIGSFPKGRYAQSAVMNRRYLNNALDAYNRDADKNGTPHHPLSDKSLNLMWLRVPDTKSFNQLAEQIEGSEAEGHQRPSPFSAPAVKCETASSGIASFFDAYRDLLWAVNYLLVPSILATMALVLACAISIGVRERRTEMAVLKVLGFGPNHIMILILGEALLIGVVSGLVSSAFTYALFNWGFGGVNFRVAFFPTFPVPAEALRWGATVGAVTAFIGSIIPAWTARTVKVSEVFAKVA